MLKANKYEEVPEGVSVEIQWDDSEDIMHTETRVFKDKEHALRYYASMCRTYIIMGNEKVRNAAEAVYIKLPRWTDDLVMMDAPEMAFKVLEQMQHIDFRKADEKLRAYLKNTVKKVQSAAEELQAICKKYTDIRKP